MISRIRLFTLDRIRRQNESKLSPHTLTAGDTFIVEFPKSGITWLTILLANAFARELGHTNKVTFGSVRRYVPDLHASRAIAPSLGPSMIRFYKSHDIYNRNYVNSIYLVRHPVNVMLSYHKFRSNRDPATPNFEKFLDNEEFGIRAWKRHVRSWLDTNHDSSQRQLHLVRYEDLLQNAQDVIDKLNENFCWGLSGSSIHHAISLSSRQEMQAQEQLYRSNNPNHDVDFVGRSNGNKCSPETRAKIVAECAIELKHLKYD